MPRKRYALVGTGSRAGMFLDALASTYRDGNELVALCDVSQVRMQWHQQRLHTHFGLEPLPLYAAERFDAMLAETHPDSVIVTTVDATHHGYIMRALEQGVDVITEKPMTTTLAHMQAILQTIERTGRSVRVTFNARHEPMHTRVRELLLQGVIGTPLAVDVLWMLDTRHGADYFRRWHREKQNSGGLLVHKATHHFDLVNWWLGAYPQEVFAMGALQFYGKENAQARGEHYAYDRYTGVPQAGNDPFGLYLESDKELRGLYLAAEEETGYVRDRNVFGEPITIEDTMRVIVRYRSGVLLSYSLLAYAPQEGLHIAITGTKGRLEMDVAEPVPTLKSNRVAPVTINQEPGRSVRIRAFPMFGTLYDVEVEESRGGHVDADARLLEQLFAPAPPSDPLQCAASHIDGAASLLVGFAANESMRTGEKVVIDDVFLLPERM